MENSRKIKFTIVSWDNYTSIFSEAAKSVDEISANVFSLKKAEKSDEEFKAVSKSMLESDIILLYRSGASSWEKTDNEIKKLGSKNIISLGGDTSCWALSTVASEIVTKSYMYLSHGGGENYSNMLRYIIKSLYDIGANVVEPIEKPWQGLYHPQSNKVFETAEDYLNWYNNKKRYDNYAGIMFSRHNWLSENTDMIDSLIYDLESMNIGVIAAFSYSSKDKNTGNLSGKEIIERYFLDSNSEPVIKALVKLTSMYANDADDNKADESSKAAKVFENLGVPVFQPVFTTYKTQDEWEADKHGLGAMTGWAVTLPEFEGVIEPMMLGVSSDNNDELKKTIAIKDRSKRIAGRIAGWINMGRKPASERKVVFILNNNPCASTESSVGGAANLDSLQSIADIISEMKRNGYISDAPETGEELIKEIMDKKAVSEFRWTAVEEIVKKGGALDLLSAEEYTKWFDRFPEKLKRKVCETWGNPPGEQIGDVPVGMVYNNKIVISGLRFGNVIVCVQPKRGCAGSKCNGKVCKILHDPDVPPTHQYLATYRYFENVFGADCIIHVGTHGNMEFLPGKGVGLSSSCSPDAVIGTLPHLYIYNADNPSEGSIAKRRGLATLIDHMQVLMLKSGLTEDLEILEQLLSDYQSAAGTDKTRAHQLEHLIIDSILNNNLSQDIGYHPEMDFSEISVKLHETLTLIKSSQINKGMHVFGKIPSGDDRVNYISSIFRADTDNGLDLRSSIFRLFDLSLNETLNKPGEYNNEWSMTNGQILEIVDDISVLFIKDILNGKEGIETIVSLTEGKIKNKSVIERFGILAETVKDINNRIELSDEHKSLLNGLEAKYIRTGPSGKMTRGRYDVLPSGKNFYTLDIHKLPTKASYRVGSNLADVVIAKHVKDEGRMPENIAIYWNCMDITCCDGEGMGQIMVLLGAIPKWNISGQVNGFEIISLEELGRPRIDVTIRIGGILRDSFPECISYIDEVIRTVALLDEPVEMNYVRKHTLQKINDESNIDADTLEKATTRIFGAKAGTFLSGVNLAVYASAWKDESDLADIFIYWNQYGYGKNIFGKEMPESLVENLKTVDITFNKAYTDEYDLFGCCSHFGTHGGLTVAARSVSGKEVRAYYGDTRDTKNVGVRDLSGEVRRVIRTKLLNPKWIEGMRDHGYKGLGDISKQIGRLYGWEATTGEVDDWIFDDIARTYVLNDEIRKDFEDNNPWALEEISRRLLEASKRGLWSADEQVLNDLKDNYIEIESWIEERMGDVESDIQGGNVDIFNTADIPEMMNNIKHIHKLIKKEI